jgi:hypothetical protein
MAAVEAETTAIPKPAAMNAPPAIVLSLWFIFIEFLQLG